MGNWESAMFGANWHCKSHHNNSNYNHFDQAYLLTSILQRLKDCLIGELKDENETVTSLFGFLFMQKCLYL